MSMRTMWRGLGLVLLLSVAGVMPAWGAASWPEHVVAGMYGPPHNTVSPESTGGKAPFRAHDALAAGMPTGWSWSRGARAMAWNNLPASGGAVAHVVPALTGRAGDAAPNTHGKSYRLHVRNYELWYFSAESRTWILLDATKAKGGYYTKGPGFSHTGTMPGRVEPDGSVSFAPKAGNWQHFYTSTWPNKRPAGKVLYLHMRAEMKLSGPDAGTAKVIGSVGADYKPVDSSGRLVNASGAADGSAPIKAVLSSAMRYIGPEYAWYTSTTMTPDEIRANPPPAPASWPAVVPVPRPEPVPAPPSRPDYTALLQRLQGEHRALGETIDQMADALTQE